MTIIEKDNTSIQKKVNSFLLTYSTMNKEDVTTEAKALYEQIPLDKRLSIKTWNELIAKVKKVYQKYK